MLLEGEQDDWRDSEDEGWEEERQIETDVMLSVNHGQGSAERSHVDQQVEVDVDTGRSGGGVDNLLLSVLVGSNVWSVITVLFSDQRRDVGFESTCSEAHDDKSDSEDSESSFALDDDRRNSRDDQDSVTDHSETDRVLDSEVTTEILISDVCSTKRCDVRPEGIDFEMLVIVS